MNPRDYFMMIRDAGAELEKLQDKVDAIRDRSTSISAPMGGAIGGRQRGYSRVENAAISLVDLDDLLADRQAAYTEMVMQAERVLALMPAEKHRTLLRLRYIDRLDWKIVADRMGYTNPESVYKVHGHALGSAGLALNRLDR